MGFWVSDSGVNDYGVGGSGSEGSTVCGLAWGLWTLGIHGC